LREIGLLPVVNRRSPPGLDVATAVLAELGQSAVAIDAWVHEQVMADNQTSILDEAAA
jgi:hypothetical protein